MKDIQRYYTGESMEKGRTSISGPVTPAITWLIGKGHLPAVGSVLDYGAGRYARNCDFFRKQGQSTYAYDPYNFNDANDGWQLGKVCNQVPVGKFDSGFTSYVLNVLPKHEEAKVVAILENYTDKLIHIVRNTDVVAMVKEALAKKEQTVWAFFIEHFWQGSALPEPIDITDDVIKSFCYFGVKTSKGFQRITSLEDYGYTRLKSTNNFKIYIKA